MGVGLEPLRGDLENLCVPTADRVSVELEGNVLELRHGLKAEGGGGFAGADAFGPSPAPPTLDPALDLSAWDVGATRTGFPGLPAWSHNRHGRFSRAAQAREEDDTVPNASDRVQDVATRGYHGGLSLCATCIVVINPSMKQRSHAGVGKACATLPRLSSSR